MVSLLSERQASSRTDPTPFHQNDPRVKQLPYEERLEQLGLWSLEERRNRTDLLQVFKMFQGLSSIPFSQIFTFSNNTRTRGHTAKINKFRSSLDIRGFLADRTNSRAIATLLRLSSVCDVMYCG